MEKSIDQEIIEINSRIYSIMPSNKVPNKWIITRRYVYFSHEIQYKNCNIFKTLWRDITGSYKFKWDWEKKLKKQYWTIDGHWTSYDEWKDYFWPKDFTELVAEKKISEFISLDKAEVVKLEKLKKWRQQSSRDVPPYKLLEENK